MNYFKEILFAILKALGKIVIVIIITIIILLIFSLIEMEPKIEKIFISIGFVLSTKNLIDSISFDKPEGEKTRELLQKQNVLLYDLNENIKKLNYKKKGIKKSVKVKVKKNKIALTRPPNPLKGELTQAAKPPAAAPLPA